MTEQSFHRRSVLTGVAVAAAATGAVAMTTESAAAASRYFQHGVASGDPLPGGAVLWTRVTPTTASTPGSGVGPSANVTWQVSTSTSFLAPVKHGTFMTGPTRDHTVKVDVTGLLPAKTYYYRFVYAGSASPTGRFKTAPAATALPDRLRLGIVSCANLQAGWFSAYRHLAGRTDLDAILHLGDYLYEYGVGEYGYGQADVDIREHSPKHEMVSLADYRQRHAQYKQDPDLQKLHSQYAFITTWDDHEVTNDSWKDGAENHDASEGDYLARKAVAQRVYDEWMPIRLSGTAALGDGTRIYRRLKFGQLAELTLLDLRSHRDEQVAATVPSPIGPTLNPELANPDRTIAGAAQLAYLKESLDNERAQWKLIGNPVMIAPLSYASLPTEVQKAIAEVTGTTVPEGPIVNPDQWDGYTDDRKEVLTHILDQGVRDTVFLTGDIHSAWASDLPADPATYPVVDTSLGVEFVCTSVTSNNLKDITGTPRRTTSVAVETAIKAVNRHVKYLNFDDHGYSVLDVTPTRTQMDYFIIGDRANPLAAAMWVASYQTRSGTGKVASVNKPVGA